MKSEALLNELLELTTKNLNAAQEFRNLSTEKLSYKSNKETWSILECIEHLNCYGTYYIPAIKSKMQASNHNKTNIFKTGLLGNYFAKSMQPKEKLNTMKTIKSTNPIYWKTDVKVLDKFIFQQEQLIDLLNQAKHKNLNKIKIPNSILKLVKLNLGDTFRIVIYHNQRHVIQAKNVLKTL